MIWGVFVCVGLAFATLGQAASLLNRHALAMALCVAGVACCSVAFVAMWGGAFL